MTSALQSSHACQFLDPSLPVRTGPCTCKDHVRANVLRDISHASLNYDLIADMLSILDFLKIEGLQITSNYLLSSK